MSLPSAANANAAAAARRKVPNLNIVISCPECKVYPPKVVERFSEGDIVCALCGLVLSDRIVDTRSEWRTFSNDDQNGDDPSRVGEASNPLLDGNHLSTRIGQVQGSDVKLTRELNRAQSKSIVDKKDNELQAAYAKITMMCDAAELPRIVKDCAKEAYKLCFEERALKGKSQESIMASVILVGCRRAEVGRTFKEILSLTNVRKKEIGKTFNIIKKILREKNDSGFANVDTANISTGQTNAETFIPRFCSHLGLSVQVANAAEYIAKHAKDINVLAGRSPLTIAASAIYMANLLFRYNITPSQISATLQVTEGTVKGGYKILYEHKEKVVDPELITTGKVSFDDLPKVSDKGDK
ncbi:ADR007Cp [Eremothecium gossypii ATCC 10895]|uniref:Transcription initiation factor IIB n=1 Tax=Eremothecium gossypii (strain ATCC 10895 / CBS 109.51 / FGSC 9923 / NRRL Y-1056) TaxID=284811 RepID=Q75AB1_EREGS|nr:ADR007Cp [Eremothecium gossypii ATCC 10895]AAS51927.2 ADR007Cp [Eremothecium gossypii ATCC 10895]AEY96227.1 FADR007Cp [Eremothecium gossypii FDAG1]